MSAWYYRTTARNAIEKISICGNKKEAMLLFNKAKLSLGEIGETLKNIRVSEEDILKQIDSIGE